MCVVREENLCQNLDAQNFRQSAILANFNSYWLELAKPDTVSNLVKLTSSRACASPTAFRAKVSMLLNASFQVSRKKNEDF